MSRPKTDEERLNELVEAFTELGPTWVRWVNACLPSDGVSYARMRLLTALQCEDTLTMGRLANLLGVTPRRVTALVEALEADGLVARHPHPTDRRSTLVSVTDAGLKVHEIGWQNHQAEVAQGFSDLSVPQQKQLLTISRALTEGMRTRLAGRSSPHRVDCAPDE
jgi:DNA-binding MarR family transcriptional regulator